ncbi:MAG: single-stranded DNA-binding protein [Candidatus Moduliflexus flocculans]|nr:single-stranded DNA-binding protein [Candidatus Moduliflexus flocculans]
MAWGNLAEICKQYLTKGQQVYIEGRLQTRRWDDKEGEKHTSVEVVANEMMMLGDRREHTTTRRCIRCADSERSSRSERRRVSVLVINWSRIMAEDRKPCDGRQARAAKAVIAVTLPSPSSASSAPTRP